MTTMTDLTTQHAGGAPDVTIAKPGPLQVVPSQPATADLVVLALDRGYGLEQIERLFEIQRQRDHETARRAYVAAMARAKAEPFRLAKTKRVGYKGQNGEFVGYAHVTLAEVVDVVTPALAQYGITHSWRVEQDAGMIRVTCVLTHELGHSDGVTLQAGADTSGKKNPIQSVASTVTYLQRYTLMSIMGIAAQDVDDDARAAGGPSGEDAALSRLLDDAEAAAAKGTAAYRAWWSAQTPAVRRDIGTKRHDALKLISMEADAEMQAATKAATGAAE